MRWRGSMSPRPRRSRPCSLPTADESSAATLASSFVGQKGGPAALAKALAGRTLSPAIGRSMLRAVSASGLNVPELTAAIESAAGLARVAAMPAGETLAAMIRAIETDGDASRGEQIYRRIGSHVHELPRHRLARADRSVRISRASAPARRRTICSSRCSIRRRG